MPIDFSPPQANLNYQITPVQYTDPLQTLAQMGQIRNQNLQRQGAQQELEQSRMQLDSNKALLKAMVDAGTDGSPDEIYQRIMQKATQSGQVLPAHLNTLQEYYTKHQQEAATLDETKRKNLQTDIDRVRGAYAPLMQPGATDEDFAAVNARLDQMGVNKNIPRLTQWTDPEHVNAYSNGLALHSQLLAEGKEQAATEASKATRAKEEVQTSEAEQKLALGNLAAARSALQSAEVDPNTGTPTPAALAEVQAQYPKVKLPRGNAPKAEWDRFLTGDLSSKERIELNRPKDETQLAMIANDPKRSQEERDQATAALQTLKSQKDIVNTETELARVATDPTKSPEQRAAANAALKRLDQSKLASRPIINNMIPGVSNAPATGDAALVHGEDYLKTLPPAFAARIKAIATGNGDAPSGRAATSGAGLQLMNALYQYDPEFTPLLGQTRKETLKEFTSTGMSHAGGQKLALNTVIHHADLYLDAAKALKNGSFRPGNEIYNKVASAFGAAPPTNAALLAQFFASETGKVATGGVPAEGEIKSILEKMSTSGSPEAMEGAGKTLIGIAAGRMIPLKELRDKAKLEKFVDILGPDAREVLQRRGFDPETMKPIPKGAAGGGVKVGDYVMYQGKQHKVTAINPKTGKLTLE